jgi:post-segregation antitoxin (ccd killing protein)
LTLVDIDIDAFRRANDMRTVRKNLTLPSWLNERAEKAGINFSKALQDTLKEQLGQRIEPRRHSRGYPAERA